MVTKIMGILNVTPDSFSDGGRYSENVNNKKILNLDKVFFHTEEMIKEGADIIDIGGESTRPGASIVSKEEELERVIPVIEGIKERFDITISLDTYKASVALEGIKSGIDIVNDIGMLSMDKDMLKVVAQNDIPYVLTHNRENYVNLIDDMKEKIKLMEQHGVKSSNIILDPGIGFNKTYEQNLYELKHLDELCKLGYKVLLGVSNKSVIGNALSLPTGERLEGTLALSVMGVMAGVNIIRVHDVKSNVRAIKMAEAVLYSK